MLVFCMYWTIGQKWPLLFFPITSAPHPKGAHQWLHLCGDLPTSAHPKLKESSLVSLCCLPHFLSRSSSDLKTKLVPNHGHQANCSSFLSHYR
jgi:hypothetical protein